MPSIHVAVYMSSVTMAASITCIASAITSLFKFYVGLI